MSKLSISQTARIEIVSTYDLRRWELEEELVFELTANLDNPWQNELYVSCLTRGQFRHI